MRTALLFLLSVCTIPAVMHGQSIAPLQLFFKMMEGIEKTKTCSYNFIGEDRFDSEMKTSEMIVRLQASPLKIYVYSIRPNPGTKALFLEGQNRNNILVNPTTFPYINLYFSPYNKIMRKHHHFTIYETGFDYLKSIMKHYYTKDTVAFSRVLFGGAIINFKNISYYQLVIDQPAFAYVKYTVQPGEDLVSIGKKMYVNDDMIRLANPTVGYFDDVKAGQVIQVPNCFAKKIIFYIDKTTWLPMIQEMYDEKGLYGRYTFSSFVQNPVFSTDEFTKGKAEYGF